MAASACSIAIHHHVNTRLALFPAPLVNKPSILPQAWLPAPATPVQPSLAAHSTLLPHWLTTPPSKPATCAHFTQFSPFVQSTLFAQSTPLAHSTLPASPAVPTTTSAPPTATSVPVIVIDCSVAKSDPATTFPIDACHAAATVPTNRQHNNP